MEDRPSEELKKIGDHFLDGLLQKTYSFAQHLDHQVNILLGISSAVFLFSLSRVLERGGGPAFLVLSVCAGLSSLVALFAVHPPKFMRKRGQKESVFYHKHAETFSSSAEYAQALGEVIEHKEAMIQEYATEAYNVSKYYYRPKRRLFHLSRNLLLFGVLASFVLSLVSLITH